MKYCISIFCLPHEIDDLELTLNQMKKAFRYVDEQNFILDITLALTGELTLWEQSKIPIDYFTHKYEKLRKSCDWITNKYFRVEQHSEVLGCVSKRRKVWKEHQNVDYHIWLDTDIIFDERTLAYIDSSIQSLSKDYPYAVVSPEIVKVWDNTWDCLVNEQFLNEPLDYQKTNDPYLDCGIKGDIGIETINNTIPNQPRMKFAGGWFTCISKKLLDRITVPDSLGHYGLEDTFIMWGSDKLKLGQQFKIKNLVVCENYKYRDNKYLTNFIAGIDRREEFKEIAHKNFQKEYDSL
tara:strand:- start:1672 stop:2553 length:882 start_codon:yes stop_codon:yes gene_type:complete